MLESISVNVLDNGLKIITCPKNDTPVISIQVWYKTGSVNEYPGIYGISHILEHMMFRGSKNVASEEHTRKINDIGGHCNAFTSEDVTSYLNSVPKQYLSMVLDLEADRMENLLPDENLFETEKKVIIEEYHTYMNNPVAKAFLEFRTIFFNNNPYQISPLGTIENIKSISSHDLKNYYEKWYSPNNAVIVIVGDFLQADQIVDLVNNKFGHIKEKRNLNNNPQKNFRLENKSNWMKRKVDFDVPILIMGFPSPASSSEDVLPMEILQMIISQGETSRFNREIVRKQNLAVMAGGMNHTMKNAGMSILFSAFTPDIGYKKIEWAMNKQIAVIKDNGISQQEMEKVKNITLTNRTFELFTGEYICQRLGYSEIIDGDYKIWVKKLEALRNLDRDTLLAAAQKYWNNNNKHTLYLCPQKINPILYIFGMLRRFFPKTKQ
ncbi:MAG: pitrilysin family protein [Chitinispirillia bacterium]|jgi:zinc protease